MFGKIKRNLHIQSVGKETFDKVMATTLFSMPTITEGLSPYVPPENAKAGRFPIVVSAFLWFYFVLFVTRKEVNNPYSLETEHDLAQFLTGAQSRFIKHPNYGIEGSEAAKRLDSQINSMLDTGQMEPNNSHDLAEAVGRWFSHEMALYRSDTETCLEIGNVLMAIGTELFPPR